MPPSCWGALAACGILLLMGETIPPSPSPSPPRTTPSPLGEEDRCLAVTHGMGVGEFSEKHRAWRGSCHGSCPAEVLLFISGFYFPTQGSVKPQGILSSLRFWLTGQSCSCGSGCPSAHPAQLDAVLSPEVCGLCQGAASSSSQS